MLGEEATAACPYSVVEHGIIRKFEINLMTPFDSSLQINIGGLGEESAKCIMSSFFQQLAHRDAVV